MKLLDIYLESLISNDEKPIKKTKVAAAVIIKKGDNDEDLLLIIRRSKTDTWSMTWEIPRGHVNGNETLTQGLKREVKEETGLDIIPIRYIGKFSYLAEQGKRETIQYNYLCKMKNPDQKVKLSFEHDSHRWIQSMGEVELMVPSEMKKIISRVFNRNEAIIDYPERNEEIGE